MTQGCPFCEIDNRQQIEYYVLAGHIRKVDLDLVRAWPLGTTEQHMAEHNDTHYNCTDSIDKHAIKLNLLAQLQLLMGTTDSIDLTIKLVREIRQLMLEIEIEGADQDKMNNAIKRLMVEDPTFYQAVLAKMEAD